MFRDLVIDARATVAEADVHWRFSRSSGPGGQGVNTTDSRVEVSVTMTDVNGVDPERLDLARERLANRLVDDVLTITSSRYRSQLRNREDVLERLAETLRDALRPEARKRKPTKPSRGAVRRRLEDKRRRSEVKRSRRAGRSAEG